MNQAEMSLHIYYHFRSGLPFFYVDFCESAQSDLWQNATFVESPKHEKRQTVETGQN